MAQPNYASEIQSEALKAVGARYRRDIRFMLYAGLAIALVLLSLLALSLRQEDQLSSELAVQHQLIINGQAHTKEVLASQTAQTDIIKDDIQCVASLFAIKTSVTITDLQTCQTEPSTSGSSSVPVVESTPAPIASSQPVQSAPSPGNSASAPGHTSSTPAASQTSVSQPTGLGGILHNISKFVTNLF